MQPATKQPRRFEITLIALMSALLAINVIGTASIFNMNVSGSDEEAVIYAGGAGFILGQVALLALWGVLGGESVVYRFPRSAGFSIAIFYSWVAGTHIADDPLPIDVAFVLSLFGLLVFSVLSAPLWFIGSTWPMRIWHPDQVTEDRFSIGTLLVWTTAVAGCVAIGTHLFQANVSPGGLPPRAMILRMIPMLAGIGIFIGALVTPLLWGVLAPKPKGSVWVAIGAVFVMGPPVLLGLILVLGGTRMSTSDFIVALFAWYVFYFVMAIVVVGCLLFIRAFGFRYVTPSVQQELLSPFADGS